MGKEIETTLLGKTVERMDPFNKPVDGSRGKVVGIYVGTSLNLIVQLQGGLLADRPAMTQRVVEDGEGGPTPEVIEDPLPKAWEVASFEWVDIGGGSIEIVSTLRNRASKMRRPTRALLSCPFEPDTIGIEQHFLEGQQSVVFTIENEDCEKYEIQIELDMVAGCWNEDSMQLEDWEKVEE